MASRSEVGHAKNVAGFSQIVVKCEEFGSAYNPSNSNIKLPAIQQALAQAQLAIQAVNAAKTNLNNATNAREVVFTKLDSFSTRIVNALDASGALPQTVADAKTILRKIRGGSKRKKEKSEETVTSEPTEGQQLEPTPRTISTSQRSFDSLVEHFARLVLLVSSDPNYNPNEPDLTIAALQTKQQGLQAANLSVQQSIAESDSARITRDKLLYYPETGLVAITSDIKKYVKSIYGSTSPEYKTISGISVRNSS